MIFRDHYTGRGHQVLNGTLLQSTAENQTLPVSSRSSFRKSFDQSLSPSLLPPSPRSPSLLSKGSRVDNFLVIRSALVKTEKSSLRVVSSVVSFVPEDKIPEKSTREITSGRISALDGLGRVRYWI